MAELHNYYKFSGKKNRYKAKKIPVFLLTLPTLMFLIAIFGQTLMMAWFGLWCLTPLFDNISAISWQLVLLVEETRVPGENHRPATSH